MHGLTMTRDEYTHTLDVLDRWADTLVAKSDQQITGAAFGLMDDGQGGRRGGMCALGALHYTLHGEPRPHDFYVINLDGAPDAFVLDLVARTAARQNRVDDYQERRDASHLTPIPFLNDVAGLSFVQFAGAVRSTRLWLMEHVAVEEEVPTPDQVPA